MADALSDETDVPGVLTILANHGVALDRVRAWTICYFPFTMGGNVWRPAGATVPCERPIQIGEFFVCQINGPDGMTAVCEFSTGAIVGETIDQVRHDIEEAYAGGRIEIMRKQVAEARDRRPQADDLTPADLWNRLRNARRAA